MLFSRLADLPLEIDAYAFERLTGGEHITTMLRLVGGGTDGVGEEIGGMDAAYHDTLAEQTSWPLAGSWTLESFLDALASFDQWGGEEPEWGDFARPFRNWMFESAALDLALRQAGVSLADALGRTPGNVTFVNSFPLGEGASWTCCCGGPRCTRASATRSTRRRLDPLTRSTRWRRPGSCARWTSRAGTGWRSRATSRRCTRPWSSCCRTR